jgi:hypothetical protein
MSLSRSPRRRSGGRYHGLGNDDLAIRIDILLERVEDLQKDLQEVKLKADTAYEWVPWLHALYRWLRSVFQHCPGWHSPSRYIPAVEVVAAVESGAMQDQG